MRYVLPLLILLTWAAQAQPILSVNIDIPTVTVNQTTQQYDPMPIPVVVTIHNTGSTASLPVSVRLVLPLDLELDPSEHSATIKQPMPAVVQPNDSVKIPWLMIHPPSFKMKNYRISACLTFSPVDSFETRKLFILPPMGRPEFNFAIIPVTPLQVRTDSLGYSGNPFKIYFRLVNSGGTTADSVKIALRMPDDFELDPGTQDNPIDVGQPVPPQGTGVPRFEYDWNVRYTDATRADRDDTLWITASGEDLAGDPVVKDTFIVMHTPGLSPAYDILFDVPSALQYDADSIYNPNPFRVRVTVRNTGLQNAALDRLRLTMKGEGLALQGGQQQTIPLLKPGEEFYFDWHVDAQRRSFQRDADFTAEVIDDDGRASAASATVSIPGQPYALSFADIRVPDTLALNTQGTDFTNNPFTIRYSLRNDSWYKTKVTYRRVAGSAIGLVPPNIHEHNQSYPLGVGHTSSPFSDTFTALGSTEDQTIRFHLSGISSRADTAMAERTLFVPGLRPVAELNRRGVDSLRYDALNTYAPNPFGQEFILRNKGHVTFRLDSVVLSYGTDGVSVGQPLRLDYGWNIQPGDSSISRWDFVAYERPDDRNHAMHVTAYVAGRYSFATDASVSIPGLYPVLEAMPGGTDTLAYDPAGTYAPDPFRKTLTIANTGYADLQIDSVRIAFSDNKVHALFPLLYDAGLTIRPDSSHMFIWEFTADERDVAAVVPFTYTVYFEAGNVETRNASIFIPALTPGLHAGVTGDDQLDFDDMTVYTPSPFRKSLRVENTGSAALRLDSVIVTWTDPLLSTANPTRVDINSELSPGSSELFDWDFTADRHAVSGNAQVMFSLFHSGGQVLPLVSDVFIPGRPFRFLLETVDVPTSIGLKNDDSEYEPNPFVTSFSAWNDSWTTVSYRVAGIRMTGDGIDALTQLDRISNELIAPDKVSTSRIDSFYIHPYPTDRLLELKFEVEDVFGAGDSKFVSVFIPAIKTTGLSESSPPVGFAIQNSYPNPVRDVLTVDFGIDRFSNVRLEILDLLGRRMAIAWKGAPAPGLHHVRWNTSALPAGLYFIRLTDGVRQHVRKISLLR